MGNTLVKPVKELKGFQRISLEPGQTKTVSFTIADDLLKHWDVYMSYGMERIAALWKSMKSSILSSRGTACPAMAGRELCIVL